MNSETSDYLRKYSGRKQWQLLSLTDARIALDQWHLEASGYSRENIDLPPKNRTHCLCGLELALSEV